MNTRVLCWRRYIVKLRLTQTGYQLSGQVNRKQVMHFKCMFAFRDLHLFKHTWTMSWETLFMPYASNKGADQPAHARSLISAFVVCCLDNIISLVSIFAILWLLASFFSWADWFESYLVENTEDRFSRDEVHFKGLHKLPFSLRPLNWSPRE